MIERVIPHETYPDIMRGQFDDPATATIPPGFESSIKVTTTAAATLEELSRIPAGFEGEIKFVKRLRLMTGDEIPEAFRGVVVVDKTLSSLEGKTKSRASSMSSRRSSRSSA